MPLRLRAGYGLGLAVAGVFGIEPRANQLFLLRLDRSELLLEGTELSARVLPRPPSSRRPC